MIRIKSPRPTRGSQPGFTYVWLLFLVAMLSLLPSISAQMDSTIGRRDRELQLLAIGGQFRDAIGRYYELDAGNGHVKEYPTSLDQLLRDNRVVGMRRHLRRIFVDPMTGSTDWGFVQHGGRIVGIHSLSSQTPIKQSGFRPEDAGFEGSHSYADWIFAYPADAVMKAQPGAASAPSSGKGTENPSGRGIER